MSFRGVLSYFSEYQLGTKNVTYDPSTNSYLFHYPCTNESECAPYEVLLSPGTYQIELWGAQGGDGRYQNNQTIRSDSGGKGAYVNGTIQFNGTVKLYLYIGGKGEDQISKTEYSLGGFNGGGKGGKDLKDDTSKDNSYPESSAGGGGSTDLRLFQGNDIESLKSRLIVAAAGGGACSTDNNNNKEEYDQFSFLGGFGGGVVGESITKFGFAGNQTHGIFGKGGNGTSSDVDNGGSSGGSGSGYYGGYTIEPDNNHSYEFGGSGGSSFISGHPQCIAIADGDKESLDHSADSIHWSKHFFTNTCMKTRLDQDFPSPYGGHEEGHSGNGCARITVISARDSLDIFPTCAQTNKLRNRLYLFFMILK